MSEDKGHVLGRIPAVMKHIRKVCSDNGIKGRRTQTRNCAVCGDKAHSLHFGGLSCDSCKAFFRRSVQSGAFRGFSCSRLGGCILTINTRRSCQKCRFTKCVSVGMEPDWVLSEQKRHSHQSKQQIGIKKKKKMVEQCDSCIPQQTHNSMSQFLSSEEQANLNKVITTLHAAKNNNTTDTGTFNTDLSCNYDVYGNSSPTTGNESAEPFYIKIRVCVHTVFKFCHSVLQSISPHTELSKSLLLDMCFVYIASVMGTELLKQTSGHSGTTRFTCSASNHIDNVTYDRLEYLSLNNQEECGDRRKEKKSRFLLQSAVNCSTEFCENFNASSDVCMADKCSLTDFNTLEVNQYYKLHEIRAQTRLCCPVEGEFIHKISNLKLDEKSLALLLIIMQLDPCHKGASDSTHTENLQEYFSLLLQHYMAWKYGQPRALILFAHALFQLSAVKGATHHGHTCTYKSNLVPMLQYIISTCWHNNNNNVEQQLCTIPYTSDQTMFLSCSQHENDYQITKLDSSVKTGNIHQYQHHHTIGNSGKTNHKTLCYSEISDFHSLPLPHNDHQETSSTYNDCSHNTSALDNDSYYNSDKLEAYCQNYRNCEVITAVQHSNSGSIPDQTMSGCDRTSYFELQSHNMPIDTQNEESDNYLCPFRYSCNVSGQLGPESSEIVCPKVSLPQFESAENSRNRNSQVSFSHCVNVKNLPEDLPQKTNCQDFGQLIQNQHRLEQQIGSSASCTNTESRYFGNSDNSYNGHCMMLEAKKFENIQAGIQSELHTKNMPSCSISAGDSLYCLQQTDTQTPDKELSTCQLLDAMLKESSNELSTTGDDDSFHKDIQTIYSTEWWLQDITTGSNSSGYLSSPSCQLSPQLSSSLSHS